MTIEEKRAILSFYCKGTKDCSSCLLNSSSFKWDNKGYLKWVPKVGSVHCLYIEKASERDLDKALELIGYKATPSGKKILTPEQQKVCTDVLTFYGYDMERMVAIEEMSELTKELSKQKRGEGNRDYLIEEIADVYLCLEKIEQMNNITQEELSEWISRKTEVIKTRIK